MAAPSYSITFHAKVSGVASTGSAGDVVLPSVAGGDFVKATAAARGTRRSTGITLASYTPNQNVEIQQVGLVDFNTFNLGAGSASWVRVSSTGTLERCTPSSGDDLIGYCDADGSVHLAPGFLTPIAAGSLISPVITGTPQYSATRGTIKTVVGEVQTSSTSATTVASYTMTNETLCAFDVIVTCARRTSVTKGGRYKRSVVYRVTGGGTPTIVGSLESGTDQETTAGDDVTVDVNGSEVRVRVTAADSDGRNWFCELRVQETLAT